MILINTSKQFQSQTRLNLMSYNIRYDITTSNASPWTERHTAISSQIKRFDVDIVGMQEVLDHQRTQLLSDLQGFASIGVGRDDGQKAGEYSPIFYNSALFARSWLDPSPKDTSSIFSGMIEAILSNNLSPDDAIKDASGKLQLLLFK